MGRNIRISAGEVVAEAELNETQIAEAIWKVLPIKASGNTWGDEIYFGIPVQMDSENEQEVVEVGDLAYWPPGHAFCIFFGPTPASRHDEVRPASAVTVVGRLKGDPKAFKAFRSGSEVIIEAA